MLGWMRNAGDRLLGRFVPRLETQAAACRPGYDTCRTYCYRAYSNCLYGSRPPAACSSERNACLNDCYARYCVCNGGICG